MIPCENRFLFSLFMSSLFVLTLVGCQGRSASSNDPPSPTEENVPSLQVSFAQESLPRGAQSLVPLTILATTPGEGHFTPPLRTLTLIDTASSLGEESVHFCENTDSPFLCAGNKTAPHSIHTLTITYTNLDQTTASAQIKVVVGPAAIQDIKFVMVATSELGADRQGKAHAYIAETGEVFYWYGRAGLGLPADTVEEETGNVIAGTATYTDGSTVPLSSTLLQQDSFFQSHIWNISDSDSITANLVDEKGQASHYKIVEKTHEECLQLEASDTYCIYEALDNEEQKTYYFNFPLRHPLTSQDPITLSLHLELNTTNTNTSYYKGALDFSVAFYFGGIVTDIGFYNDPALGLNNLVFLSNSLTDPDYYFCGKLGGTNIPSYSFFYKYNQVTQRNEVPYTWSIGQNPLVFFARPSEEVSQQVVMPNDLAEAPYYWQINGLQWIYVPEPSLDTQACSSPLVDIIEDPIQSLISGSKTANMVPSSFGGTNCPKAASYDLRSSLSQAFMLNTPCLHQILGKQTSFTEIGAIQAKLQNKSGSFSIHVQDLSY